MGSPAQLSPEWFEARKALITSTDIPVILGVSPYKSEATLALEKSGQKEPDPPSLPMLVGQALEPVLAAEYERTMGVTLRRYKGLVVHPDIEWAAASPDWRRVGERYLVEGKTSAAKRWDEHELPQDVEAQVQWAMGCTGFPVADVAALLHSRTFRVYTVEHDKATFDNLVTIAADFRARMAAGGPFSESLASLKSRYPVDDGEVMEADDELEEAVVELLRLRAVKADIEAATERLEVAVKSRMATASKLTGKGWTATWRRTKDIEQVDWKSVADGLLRQLPEDQRAALVSVHTSVRPGFRPFRLVSEREND